MMVEPSGSFDDGESLISDGSEKGGDGVGEGVEVAEKDVRLEEAYEEARRVGFQSLGPEEMDALEEHARKAGGGGARTEGGESSGHDGEGGRSVMPVMAGLSVGLPSEGGTTAQPQGAGLSGELPKQEADTKG